MTCPNCGSSLTAWDRNYCYDCGFQWTYNITYSSTTDEFDDSGT